MSDNLGQMKPNMNLDFGKMAEPEPSTMPLKKSKSQLFMGAASNIGSAAKGISLSRTKSGLSQISGVVTGRVPRQISNISASQTSHRETMADPFGQHSLFGAPQELESEEVLRILDVTPDKGLSAKQVEVRQMRDGLNTAPIVSLTDEINLFQGAMRFCPTTVSVLRDGHLVATPSTKLVVGDIVVYTAGQKIESDCRVISIIEEARIEDVHGISEIDLRTGIETQGYDRYSAHNLAFSGCKVIRGKFVGVVIATGARCAVYRLREEEEQLKLKKFRKLGPLHKAKCQRALKKIMRQEEVVVNSPEAIFRMGEITSIVTGTFGLREVSKGSTNVVFVSLGSGSPAPAESVRETFFDLFQNGIGAELVHACVLGTLGIADHKDINSTSVEKYLRNDHDTAIIHWAEDLKSDCLEQRQEYTCVGRTYKSYHRPYTIVGNKPADASIKDVYVICQGNPKVLLQACSYVAHQDNTMTRRRSFSMSRSASLDKLANLVRPSASRPPGSRPSSSCLPSKFHEAEAKKVPRRNRRGSNVMDSVDHFDEDMTAEIRKKIETDIDSTMMRGVHAIAFIRRWVPAKECQNLDGAELMDFNDDFTWLGMICLDTAIAHPELVPRLVERVENQGIRIFFVSNSDPLLVGVQAERAGVFKKGGKGIVINSDEAVHYDTQKIVEVLSDRTQQVAFGGGNRAMMTKLVVDALHDLGETVCIFDESDSSYLVHVADVGAVPGIDGSDRAREGADVIVKDNTLATLLRTVDFCCDMAARHTGPCQCQ